MNASTAHSTRPAHTHTVTLLDTSNSDTIHDVAIQDSTTGPHTRSTTSTWNGSSQRELTVKELSGKRGAHHFVERHAHQEALRLTSFQFNGNTAGYANFQYTLIRQANDLAATAYTGKGAALCDTTPRTLGVWSMTRDPASSV